MTRTKASTPADADKRFRILSLDSGGIYGLFSMLMLRDLCRDGDAPESFLRNGCVDLFAGSGAGAINALFLAKHEDPRDGIDEAIAFWRNDRLYRNNPFGKLAENVGEWMGILAEAASPQERYERTLAYWNDKRAVGEPWNAWRNALGLGSWYSAPEVTDILRSHFDDLRLGDLKHNVLITAFNWRGDPEAPTNERHWKPRVYYNFPYREPDRRALVTDVAFSALAWMYTLPIYNGEQGGDWYAPDPSVTAVTKAISFISEKLRPLDLEQRWNAFLDDDWAIPAQADRQAWEGAAEALRHRVNTLFENVIADVEDEAYKYILKSLDDGAQGDDERRRLLAAAFPYADFLRRLGELPGDIDAHVLRHLSVLSLGTGASVPFLPVETAEWGFQQWAAGMPNPALQRWIQPNQYASFQAPKQMAREQCEWLLNDPGTPPDQAAVHNRYHRLDPQVFETPVLATMLGLRNNPAYLAALLQQIEQTSDSGDVRGDLRRASEWMQAQGWFDEARWATSYAGP